MKVTILTPFSNKKYCFEDYLRGIKSLDYPKEDLYLLWYNNSNDKEFHGMLEKNIAGYSGKIVRDERKHLTIEQSTDYMKITKHISRMYASVIKHIPNCDYVFIVEDDVEVPCDSLRKLVRFLNDYHNAGVVIGNQYSRRLKDLTFKRPNCWKYHKVRTFGERDTSDECSISLIWELSSREKMHGHEKIGSGHTGCFLVRDWILRDIGFRDEYKNLKAHDINFGLWMKDKTNKDFYIDWSVKVKHWYKIDGHKGYF